MSESDRDAPEREPTRSAPATDAAHTEPEKLSALRMAGLGAPKATQFPGRNDPCLCGSGQKFKRCCGR